MSQSERSEQIGWRKFLQDQTGVILLNLGILLVLSLFLLAYRVRTEVLILVISLWLIGLIVSLIINFWRRQKFYRQLIDNLARLDQAYLVLETLEQPSFYDGKIFYQTLYQIDKSMAENVTRYREQSEDFRDYVEMWIHEVKTPLATLALISKDPKVVEQINCLESQVERILYYVRSGNAERDYLIKPTSLAKVVGEVANRNRLMLQSQSIDLVVDDLDRKVYTDAKWLEFIINQIIGNSAKYQAKQIKITAARKSGQTILRIWDDGIGISEKDLPRVFEKSFTGSNGHNLQKSTGMGLYIAKSLCDKLGHQIEIASEPGEFTELKISFSDDQYFQVLNREADDKLAEM